MAEINPDVLKNFDRVWKRVQDNKKHTGSAVLMPGREPKRRTLRDAPPGR